jgi:hypothetical protein
VAKRYYVPSQKADCDGGLKHLLLHYEIDGKCAGNAFRPTERPSETDVPSISIDSNITSTAKGLRATNKYLATRKDIFPTCLTCKKPVEAIEFVSTRTFRIRCHERFADEYVADGSQQGFYKLLAELKDREVFKPVETPKPELKKSLQMMEDSAMLTMISSSSYFPMAYSVRPAQIVSMRPIYTDNGQAARNLPMKPKPVEYAPMLPTEPAKRAITFED